jgi:hypothetical protein
MSRKVLYVSTREIIYNRLISKNGLLEKYGVCGMVPLTKGLYGICSVSQKLIEDK